MAGACGAAATVKLALLEDEQLWVEVTVTSRCPSEEPAVKVIAAMLVALVIEPLTIDHEYVAPAVAGTLAE